MIQFHLFQILLHEENEIVDVDYLLNEQEDDNMDDERNQDEPQSEESDGDQLLDYKQILKKLANDWLLVEIDHRVSKTATELFWKLADSSFYKLYETMKAQKVKRKVPQFQQLRKNINQTYVPPIKMNVGYKDKTTNETIVIENVEEIPVSKYPPDKYQMLYEEATVDVSHILDIHKSKCPNYVRNPKIQVSCDGVTENKSSSVSLDIYSFRMLNCRQIYPHKIIRPLNKYKTDYIDDLEKVLSNFRENYCRIMQYLADNLKRAIARGCLNHASLFPCEYCFQRGSSAKNNLSDATNKHLDVKLALIEEKIEQLANSASSSSSLNKLYAIKKDLEESMNKTGRSKIVWPASSRNGEPRTNEKMREIVQKIEENPNLSKEERKGVVRKSPLFDIERFNFVSDVAVDYMHTVCLGVVKRTIQLTFSVGETRPRLTKRKLSSPAMFDKLMSNTKVPREIPRRVRKLDFGVMKASEFRNIVLFFFPHVIQCIPEPEAKERKLWLSLVYMVRSCVLPSEEFRLIELSNIDYSCELFYKLYEKLFGVNNCSYNTHMVGSHMLEMRVHGPLPETSTFVFESFYGEVRNAFVPGTQSPLKQIFQKILLKRSLSYHSCEKPIFFSNHDTPLQCDTLIYTFRHQTHFLYKVMEEEDDYLICNEIVTIPCKFDELPQKLNNWSQLGVYKSKEVLINPCIIYKCNVRGKVLEVGSYLITCPNSILREN